MIEALSLCEDYLTGYGGHKKAAGVELLYRKIDGFKEAFNITAEKMIEPSELVPVLDVDLELSFKDVTSDLMEAIDKLKPFGEGNPAPLFLTRDISLKQPPRKVSASLYSVWLENESLIYEGIFYAKDQFAAFFDYGERFEIVYGLEKNHYHNSTKLVVKDVRLI
ncbi:MAG: hypothetical protein ABH858_01685 [Candidatus Omnitrophota bacterium]